MTTVRSVVHPGWIEVAGPGVLAVVAAAARHAETLETAAARGLLPLLEALTAHGIAGAPDFVVAAPGDSGVRVLVRGSGAVVLPDGTRIGSDGRMPWSDVDVDLASAGDEVVVEAPVPEVPRGWRRPARLARGAAGTAPSVDAGSGRRPDIDQLVEVGTGRDEIDRLVESDPEDQAADRADIDPTDDRDPEDEPGRGDVALLVESDPEDQAAAPDDVDPSGDPDPADGDGAGAQGTDPIPLPPTEAMPVVPPPAPPVAAGPEVTESAEPDEAEPDVAEAETRPEPDVTTDRGSPHGTDDDPDRPVVLAVMCPAGHPSPPHAGRCRTCDREIPPQQPFRTPRPPLGVLRISTGGVVPLDRGVLLGRAPQVNEELPANQRPHLLRVGGADRDISRNHAEVVLEGWHVLVRDLGSTNGTTVTLPGEEPVRLRPTEDQGIEPGSVITLADEVSLTYEVKE